MSSRRAVLAVALTVALTSPAAAQVSFSVYVALGDSATAGVVSNALVETHQPHSYPALIAKQARVQGFQQPLVSKPGLPVELELKRLYPFPWVDLKAGNPGVPINANVVGPYNNLAVPGATAANLVSTDGSAGGFHKLVLRDMGPALTQAGRLRPTVITLWIGNNDVLNAVVAGKAIDNVTLTPATTFRDTYRQIVNTLKLTGATTIIAANIPDVTVLPFVSTIKPYVVNFTTGEPVLVNGQKVPLIGHTGTPLPAGAFVTLAAAPSLLNGDGIPTSVGGEQTGGRPGRGTPLPDEVVLDPTEIAVIRERVEANNRTIAEICQNAGIPLVNVNRIYGEFANGGRVVGGVRLTNTYLTGGVFSYDGIHPTNLGYALLANEWIKVINTKGAALPFVNLAPYLNGGGSSGTAGAGAGGGPEPPPFVDFGEGAYRWLLAIFSPVRR